MRDLLTRHYGVVSEHSTLSQSQLGMDAALGSFTQQAADPASLAAMTVGSFAFRFARLGFLQGAASSGLSHFAPRFLLNGAVNLSALGVEVTAFRAANNLFGSWAGHAPQQGVFDADGWRGTFVDFAALKTIGHLGVGTNPVMTHFAQANAMVLGHQFSADLGFTEHEQGSYIERLAHAEASNLAMGAGMSLMGHLTGGRSHLIERSLDARIEAMGSNGRKSFTFSALSSQLEALLPSMSRNTTIFSSHSRSHEYHKLENLEALQGKVIIIANRGEAALRAATTAQRLGLKTVVLASDADQGSWHATLKGAIRYDIGGNSMMESYGDIEKLRQVVRRVVREQGVEAKDIIVWPGWGGSSENAELPKMLKEEGALFAGPSSFAMNLLGPKTSSNEIANEAGLRPIPSSGRVVYKTLQDIEAIIQAETRNTRPEEMEAKVAQIRARIEGENSTAKERARAEFLSIYEKFGRGPVMIKGAETGGGRGIRVIERPEDFDRLFDEAVAESRSTSPSGDVFLAKYFPEAHHLEAQVVVDAYGNKRILGIRECSLQRSQQKVQERDITALLPARTRDFIFQQAEAMLDGVRERDPEGVGYTGAVTVEFLWDLKGTDPANPFGGDPAKQLYILEANTRLQVEHCVTEEAVRVRTKDGSYLMLDFVELMFRIAAGEKLWFGQEDLRWPYATLQVRVCSEDPNNNFLPSPGTLTRLEFADNADIRIDRGVETGRDIPKDYDSMVAKVMTREAVVDLADRSPAPQTLRSVVETNRLLATKMDTFLATWEMAGVRNNIPFHRALLATPQVRDGIGYYTRFIENEFLTSKAGQRNYTHWNIAAISAAIATYVGERQKRINNLSAGRSIDDLSKIEMEIGGNEFRYDVRETGPGTYYVNQSAQKVEISGTGSLKRESDNEILSLQRTRSGKYFIQQGEEQIQVQRTDENRFELAREGQDTQVFTLESLDHHINLLGHQVSVREEKGEWIGQFEGQKIRLQAAESHQYWAQLPNLQQKVNLNRSGPIHNLTINGVNYRALVDSRKGKRYVQVEGVEYDVNIAGEGILGKEHVIASLPGKIITPPSDMPKIGQLVNEGDVLFTQEAMKMKTPIRARMSGKIIAIIAQSGALVDPNQSLVVIGPVNDDISSRRDALPPVTLGRVDGLTESLFAREAEARRTLLEGLVDFPETLPHLLSLLRNGALGYDVPLTALQEMTSLLPMAIRENDAREMLVRVLRGKAVEIEKERDMPGEVGRKEKFTEIEYVGGLLNAISAIHWLNHPAVREYFHHYLNTRETEGLPAHFITALQRALGVFGITTLEASEETSEALNEALYRIHRSHREGKISALSISSFFDIIRQLEMKELVPDLVNFQRSYYDGPQRSGGIPLVHLARETQSHLETSDKRQVWSSEFNDLFGKALSESSPTMIGPKSIARTELARTPKPAKRYLLERIGSSDARQANLATEILFERLYGGREQNWGKHETLHFSHTTEAADGIGVFKDHDSKQNRSVVFARASSLADIPAALERAKANLSGRRTKENVIEISLTHTSENNIIDDAALETAIQAGTQNIQNLKRVTIALARNKPGNGPDAPAYRTYRPDGAEGKFIHHKLFDDIHPMDAWKIFELDRWLENFIPERIPDVLLPEIYAFRLRDRASFAAKKDPRKEGDLRNLIVAQVTGDLTYQRFGATLETQLMGLYRRLNTNGPVHRADLEALNFEIKTRLRTQPNDDLTSLHKEIEQKLASTLEQSELVRLYRLAQEKLRGPLTSEEEIALRAIPWGLKLAGVLPADFNPFAIDIMQGPAQEVLSEFIKDPDSAIPLLQRAARALDGKIYSVPEAERQAMNAATSMHRVQATTPGGPTEGRIDLYIHAPLEAANDELAFTVGRLVHHFSDPRIEKTAIRFHRAEEGHYQEYVASVRTPASTRIDMPIEVVTERNSHTVRTSLVKKELAALAKNNLYVYARVRLIEAAIREIWPHEIALPPDAVHLQEMVLRGDKLVEVERDPGKNKEGMIVFEATIQFPIDLQGNTYERKMMWIGNDASVDGGGLGPTEGRIYEAAFERAIEKGMPVYYASDSSGAAMAGPFSNYAGQVFRSLHKTKNPNGEGWVLWATEDQLKTQIGPEGRTKDLRSLVGIGREVEFEGVRGFEVNDISGDIFLSTESLKASAQTARITALANKRIPVFGSAHGVTIGIGTYDWVLSVLNMIPIETSPSDPKLVLSEASAALAGPRSVTATGLGAVTRADQYAGARRLAAAGIASQTPIGEMGVATNTLRMLSLLPSHRGEEAPRVATGDSPDRDVGEALQSLIPERRKPFDMRAVIQTLFDQGPLGGVFELWKDFGPTALVGFARLNGRTVAYAFPQPKPDTVSADRGRFFGSTLDYESSFKVAMIKRVAKRLGLPLIEDPAFAGFDPTAPSVSKRTYRGGAEIVEEGEEADNITVQYLHRFAEWWGGCVAVTEKSISTERNITTLSDATAQIGILGAEGAMEVPKVSRVRDAAFENDTEAKALRARLAKARDTEAEEIRRRLKMIELEITDQVKAFYMLVNTADRAMLKGTVDRVIQPDDIGKTRRILIDAMEAAIKDKKDRDATNAARTAALQILRGVVALTNSLPSLELNVTLQELPDQTVRFCVGASICIVDTPDKVWANFQDILARLDLSAINPLIPNIFKGVPKPPK